MASDNASFVTLRKRFTLRSAIATEFVTLGSWISISSSILIALEVGGLNVLFWGWIIAVILQMSCAASLAEPCSIWPGAGGQSAWVYNLAPQQHRRFLAYITTWIVIVGFTFLGVAGHTFMAEIILAMVVLKNPTFVIQTWHISILIVAIAVITTAMGMLGSRFIPKANTFTFFSSVLAIIVVSLVLLIESRGDYNTASFAFITVENESGWTDSFVPWAIGLSQSVLATTAYDTVVHYSEECADPGKIMPLAMLYGLGIDGIVTLVYAIVLIFTVGSDITTLADSPLGFPFAQVLLNRTGSVNGTIVILFWMMTIFIYAIIDVDMAIARMIMIFARERGTPFPSVFEAVLPKFDTPKWAPFFALIVQSGVAWIFVGSEAAFISIISSPVLILSCSYSIVAGCMIYARPRMETNPRFYLGPWFGPFCNVITIVFTLFILVILSMPSALPVSAAEMNYTSVFVVASFLSGVLCWFCHGSKHYLGPLSMTSHAERTSQESTQEVDEKPTVEVESM